MISYLLRVLNSLYNHAHTLEKFTALPRSDHEHSIFILHKLVCSFNSECNRQTIHYSSVKYCDADFKPSDLKISKK